MRNHRFRVNMGDDVSSWKYQWNGLPEESVQAPTMFNIYMNDLPVTESRKNAYADDIFCTKQASSSSEIKSKMHLLVA